MARVVEGERPFLEALLPHGLRELLTRLTRVTLPVRDVAGFNIGYVTGDKAFFHPDGETVAKHGLPISSLRPALISSRRLTGKGLWTAALQGPAAERLFLPPADRRALSAGEIAYIAEGEKAGVHRRYKCRIRDPWYVTPGVRVPDLLIPVFADTPLMLVNDGAYAASNSLLAGYLRAGTARQFASAWYSSLTLLQVELNVHHLGGGVMVFVPQEAGAIRIAREVGAEEHLEVVDERLRAGDIDGAYAAGDFSILEERLSLGAIDVRLIHDGIAILRHWRSARPGGLVEYIPEDEPRLEGRDHSV